LETKCVIFQLWDDKYILLADTITYEINPIYDKDLKIIQYTHYENDYDIVFFTSSYRHEYVYNSISNIFNYALEKMGGKNGLSSRFENIVNFAKTIFNVISFGVKLISPVFEFIAKIVIDFTSTILNVLDKVYWAVGKVAKLLGKEEFKIRDKNEERQSYDYNKNNTLAENVFGKKVVTVFDTKTEKTKLNNRLKSFIWRAGGFTLVAMLAYFLQIGDLWAIDVKTLVNIGAVALSGLVVNEITKYLNS